MQSDEASPLAITPTRFTSADRLTVAKSADNSTGAARDIMKGIVGRETEGGCVYVKCNM